MSIYYLPFLKRGGRIRSLRNWSKSFSRLILQEVIAVADEVTRAIAKVASTRGTEVKLGPVSGVGVTTRASGSVVTVLRCFSIIQKSCEARTERRNDVHLAFQRGQTFIHSGNFRRLGNLDLGHRIDHKGASTRMLFTTGGQRQIGSN